MIEFVKDQNSLILVYTPESIVAMYDLIKKIKNNDTYRLHRVFHLTKHNLMEEFKGVIDKINLEILEKNIEDNVSDLNFESLNFEFGVLQGEYYKINKSILNIKNDLYIHKKIRLEQKMFVAYYNIPIFRYIDNLINEPIYLGGSNTNAISYEDFLDILKQFPNSEECKKYRSARVSSILSQHFENRNDAIEKYENYMNRKKSIQGRFLLEEFSEYEKDKYKTILKKLNNMLCNEQKYNEEQWQKEIIEILRLIFPKYINVFDKVKIKDFYKNKDRELDYLLVDSEGHIDIVEIKRPSVYRQIVSKQPYRENHFPVRELSGTVMQVEKYILHLNKWGKTGEDVLNKRYKEKLPENFKIKITNPGAMIILGRSNNLNMEQKTDFEIIRRKYKNIIDIITYDDLIRRLEFIISQYEQK